MFGAVFNVLTLSDEGGLVVFNFLNHFDKGEVVLFNFMTNADEFGWLCKSRQFFADVKNKEPHRSVAKKSVEICHLFT